MLIKEIFTAVKCDRCGTECEGGEYTFFSDESSAIENVWESNWHIPDNKPHEHYCPNCYIEKEDETIEILPPWPDHIKKLRKFLGKITKVYVRDIYETENGEFVFTIDNVMSGLSYYDRQWILSFLGDKFVSETTTTPNKYGSYQILITVKS
jgi:hypothetical protein